MAAHALGKESVFRVEFQPRRIVGLVAAVARDAHVAGRDALHRPIVGVEDFGSREYGEYLESQPLGLLGEPATEIAEATGVGTLILHEAGRDELGYAELLSPGQDPGLVAVDRHLGQRATLK